MGDDKRPFIVDEEPPIRERSRAFIVDEAPPREERSHTFIVDEEPPEVAPEPAPPSSERDLRALAERFGAPPSLRVDREASRRFGIPTVDSLYPPGSSFSYLD